MSRVRPFQAAAVPASTSAACAGSDDRPAATNSPVSAVAMRGERSASKASRRAISRRSVGIGVAAASVAARGAPPPMAGSAATGSRSPYQIINARLFQSPSADRLASRSAIAHRQSNGSRPMAPARCSRTSPAGSAAACSANAVPSHSGAPADTVVPVGSSTSSRTAQDRTEGCGSASRPRSQSRSAAPTACAAHSPRSRRVGSSCVSASVRSRAPAAEQSCPPALRSARIRRDCRQNQSLRCS